MLNSQTKPNFFLCLYCNTRIPLISIQETEGSLGIKIQCQCLDNCTLNLDIEDYVQKSSSCSSLEIDDSDFYCIIHPNETINTYCFRCNKAICSICKTASEHFNDYTIVLSSEIIDSKIASIQTHLNHIEETFNYNKQIKDKVIEMNKDNLTKLQLLNQAYERNYKNNQCLVYYITSVISTYKQFKYSNHRNLIETIFSITCTNNSFDAIYDNDHLNDYIEALIQYYKRNFIILVDHYDKYLIFDEYFQFLTQLNNGKIIGVKPYNSLQVIDLFQIRHQYIETNISANDYSIICIKTFDNSILGHGNSNTIFLWKDMNKLSDCESFTYRNNEKWNIQAIMQLNNGLIAVLRSRLAIVDIKLKQLIALIELPLNTHSIQLIDGRLVCVNSSHIFFYDTHLFKCQSVINTKEKNIFKLYQLRDGRLLVLLRKESILVVNVNTMHYEKKKFNFKYNLSIHQLKNNCIAFGSEEGIDFLDCNTLECYRRISKDPNIHDNFVELNNKLIIQGCLYDYVDHLY